MRKLEEVMDSVKYGSVFIAKKENSIYNGYMFKYDGKIFKDVSGIDLGQALKLVPNIEEQIDEGYSYYVVYDREKEKFVSSIISLDTTQNLKNPTNDNLVKCFQVFSDSFLDGMIDLDAKILEEKSKKSLKYRIKTKFQQLVS